jgi:hypothetical protein
MYKTINNQTLEATFCLNFKQVEEAIIEWSKLNFPSISNSNISSFCDSSGKTWWEYIVGDQSFSVTKSEALKDDKVEFIISQAPTTACLNLSLQDM